VTRIIHDIQTAYRLIFNGIGKWTSGIGSIESHGEGGAFMLDAWGSVQDVRTESCIYGEYPLCFLSGCSIYGLLYFRIATLCFLFGAVHLHV
jgi:hypothetical protein